MSIKLGWLETADPYFWLWKLLQGLSFFSPTGLLQTLQLIVSYFILGVIYICVAVICW